MNAGDLDILKAFICYFVCNDTPILDASNGRVIAKRSYIEAID